MWRLAEFPAVACFVIKLNTKQYGVFFFSYSEINKNLAFFRLGYKTEIIWAQNMAPKW